MFQFPSARNTREFQSFFFSAASVRISFETFFFFCKSEQILLNSQKFPFPANKSENEIEAIQAISAVQLFFTAQKRVHFDYTDRR